MQQGLRRTVIATVVALVATVPAVPAVATAAPVGSRSGAASTPAVVTESGILPARSPNSTWAAQILRRTHGVDQSDDEIQVLARALDTATSPATAIRARAFGSGALSRWVGDLYLQLLDRPADIGAQPFWAARIRGHGYGIEHVVVSLLISGEAYRRAGGTNGGYVDWVYEHMLGRAADAPGRTYWIARLASGTSRDRFVRSFLRSGERARTVVRADFERYLGRAADPSGLAHWVSRYTAASVGELDVAVALLASAELRGSGCGYDAASCLLPFPSNRYAVRDATTSTNWRIGLKPEWMPRNAAGKSVSPIEWNRNDGFSVGQAAVTRVPGVDLAQSAIAPLTDIGSSLDPDAPIVIIDAATGERHPYFAELDANVPDGSDEQLLIIRPAVNYEPGHHYAVALRNLKDAAGNPIATSPGFATDRARIAADEQRDAYDIDLTFGLDALDDAGVDVTGDDIFQAWTFTTATTANTTGRMLHIRDDALADLGDDAPAFTVTSVDTNPGNGIARRVQGTFQVPNYLKGAGAPGNAFNNDPSGVPQRNGTYTASFDCLLPVASPGDHPRAVIYGHGLFGDRGEVGSGPQRAMVRDHQMAYCATDWIGMSENDIANAAVILQDVSTFPTLVDRSQQGMLNTIFLGQLMTRPGGFASHQAFSMGPGAAYFGSDDLFYDGNSQGAVIGGAFVAVDPQVTAGVLGVAGMNYSTLLERSVDFDPFFTIMRGTYPNPVDREVGLQLIQMLWDRGETNGYAAHLNASNNLPGTPDKRVLIHTALGDHQVATLTAEIEARTAGIAIHRPVYGPARTADVDPAWGLDAISHPSSGGGLVVWDSGAALAPLRNVPPRSGPDPHSDPRNSPEAQAQKAEFLRVGGTLIDVCAGAPCTAP